MKFHSKAENSIPRVKQCDLKGKSHFLISILKNIKPLEELAKTWQLSPSG